MVTRGHTAMYLRRERTIYRHLGPLPRRLMLRRVPGGGGAWQQATELSYTDGAVHHKMLHLMFYVLFHHLSGLVSALQTILKH